MANVDNYPPASFCWAELATSDQAGAKHFYSQLFGWTIVDQPIPGGVYTIFHSDGNSAAAAYSKSAEESTHWNAYFSVANVDESAAKVTAAGGKISGAPFDVMDAGRMAIASDPQGAPFCLWQANKNIGAKHGGPLNRVSWPELATPDPSGAVAFYTSLFDWKTNPEAGFDTAHYVEWLNGGKPIGGLMPMRGDMWKGVPPHWMLYVTVANCDDSAAKAKELGANVCVPPTDIPNVGRFSVITDPQGAVFSLIQL
jgi:predicted enzyme related to lactoylglutathione lyase